MVTRRAFAIVLLFANMVLCCANMREVKRDFPAAAGFFGDG
jgi:hypothetical protein